jgi:hypothetical protein
LPGMDLFDRWEAVPALPGAALSFGDLEAAPTPVHLVRWRLDLPPDPAAALQQLDDGEAQAQTGSAGLDQVPGRLERLLSARQSAQSGATDFAAPTGPALSEAELGLWRWLDEAQGREVAATSYALEETRAEAAPSFTASLERLQRLLAYAAWVETRVEGQWLGQTVVTWTGDLRTVWGAGVAPAQRHWHSLSLRLALVSRGIVLRAFFITAQSAVKLTALLAVPGGAVLALPAAWTYVNQMLAEIGEYRKLANSQGD